MAYPSGGGGYSSSSQHNHGVIAWRRRRWRESCQRWRKRGGEISGVAASLRRKWLAKWRMAAAHQQL